MRPVVVGTAGHIDHGKTALIRRLTGIDTDRLKEEKERGISIDLGFAPLTLPSGRLVGVVDVPGHERFVKNMLAGATGIDLVLFVIAADEGVMPQTREHLAIVDLLGVAHGVVALTKADLATPEQLKRSADGARALLEHTALSDVPLVPVSSTTGAGIPDLLRALDLAVSTLPGRDSGGPARLPVDRVFSIEGIGTVVTGTLWSGTVRAGDTLALLPVERAVRVRQVEVHDQPAPAAVAGNRTAIALHGVSREEARRGDWLVTPGRFQTSEMLDVKLRLIATAEKPLANRARVRIHLGASETLARVVLFNEESLPPGAAAFAQLRMEAPVVAARGDRLVVRSYSPAITIGGATVVDPSPARRPRLDPPGVERLQTLETGTLRQRLAVLARETGPQGLKPEAASLRLGAEAERVVDAAGDDEMFLRLRDGRILTRVEWGMVLDRIVLAVQAYGAEHKLRHGAPKGEIKSRLQRDLEGTVFDEGLDAALGAGRLTATGDRVTLPEARPAPTADLARAIDRLEQRLGESGFQVPGLAEAARELSPGVDPGELVRYLLETGRVVKVTSDLLYPARLWAEIESRVRRHFAAKPVLTMTEFKELLQVSRKYAVPLLEHLDRAGLTRREGDSRMPGPRLRA